ncbi:hypothetical protein [Cryobacterium sp. TMS1-13-1]|uniref:hypothetical protein n=1 Tax=Cryobacterium sp. TMS1-13-1 TaxID=1259220 RepID=UPI00106D24CB|nr:hypothetical protein [Cryobacterium sp. TMS1-13-1]TFD21341.1 hypothetical protein E3T31_10960 [Cryobacterium sp. TMS1-13-1]
MQFSLNLVDWDVVSSIAATIATLLATVGIAIAWQATNTARQSANVDRRTYLDGMFDNMIARIDEFDTAGLAYWDMEPVESNIRAGNYSTTQQNDTYPVFHNAFSHARSSIERVFMTGLGDLKSRSINHLDGDLAILRAALWATYHCQINFSPRECKSRFDSKGTGISDQTWESAWEEVRHFLESDGQLSEESGLLERARSMAEKSEHMENNPRQTRLQLADRVLRIARQSVRQEYRALTGIHAPWHAREAKISSLSYRPDEPTKPGSWTRLWSGFSRILPRRKKGVNVQQVG